MKTQYLIIVVSIFSFSVLMAQQKEGKLSSKFEKETATKVEQQVADIKTSATSPSSTASVPVSYDFTVAGAAYTTGPDPMVEVETDVWAMIAGDANADGSINIVDFFDYWYVQNGTTYEYSKSADFNLDGAINIVDFFDSWWVNNGKASQVP